VPRAKRAAAGAGAGAAFEDEGKVRASLQVEVVDVERVFSRLICIALLPLGHVGSGSYPARNSAEM